MNDSFGAAVAHHWTLDSDTTFLNHGSFGACPTVVLQEQQRLRARLESQPLRFMIRELEELLDQAREAVARLLGAEPDGLAWVPNATAAVNAVCWSLPLATGDELLATSTTYNACANALERVAKRFGAKVVVAELPVPCPDEDALFAAVMQHVDSRTVFALIDEISSPTATIAPVTRLCRELEARGVATMVDAAHVPGHRPVVLEEMQPRWWTGNLHKWLCTPKGSAVLWTREDARDATLPLVTSHAYNSRRTDRSRYLQGFDWPGTWDPTAVLAAPAAIEFLDGLSIDGIPGVMARNRELCRQAADHIQAELGLQPTAPASMRACMTAFMVKSGPAQGSSCGFVPPLGDALYRDKIEVPVFPMPGSQDALLLRISCHAYNKLADYERLVAVMLELQEQGYWRA